MTTDALIAIFAGGLFTILMGILAWIGARVHRRLDELTEVINTRLMAMGTTLSAIERDLRHELTDLDRRLSRIEGRSEK